MLKTTISVVQFVIIFISNVQGQHLSEKEELMNDTSCQLGSVTLNCDQNKVLVIQSLDFRYREGCDQKQCCTDFNETDAAPDQYDYEDDIQSIRRDCSGRSSCTVSLQGAGFYGTEGFRVSASYVVVEYFCILESRIIDVCSDTSLQSGDSPLYLTNTNYPGKPTGSNTCVCSFEVLSCSSIVNLYILDADLYLDTNSCHQTISIRNRDNLITTVIDCANHYNNTIKIETINSHYITASFNDETKNVDIDGYFFIGLSGTETNAIFTLNCSSVEETMCMDCGNDTDIDYGAINLDDANKTTYGSTASVLCDNGYETQNKTIACLATGLWENTSCSMIDCGVVSNIDSGTITLDEANMTTYGSTASVICDNDYETQKRTITCLATGLWENTSCSMTDCGPVPKIEYGNITLNDIGNTTYGSTANVKCISGYETKDSTISCLVNGMWKNASCTETVSDQIMIYIGIVAGIIALVFIVTIAIIVAKKICDRRRQDKDKGRRNSARPSWADIDVDDTENINESFHGPDKEHNELSNVRAVSESTLSECQVSSTQ